MTPEQIAAMKADREAGTPGPWAARETKTGYSVYGMAGHRRAPTQIVRHTCLKSGSFASIARADCDRIARVPDLEDEVLRLREAAQTLLDRLDQQRDDRKPVRQSIAVNHARNLLRAALNGETP